MNEQNNKSVKEIRVDIHKNAKLTLRGREELVETVLRRGLSYRRAAEEFRVDPKVVRRWVRRYQTEGLKGLLDRSSRPRRSPARTPRAKVRRICRLRRKRRLTMAQLARREKLSEATVSRILRAHGLNRLSEIEPKPPVRRYEHDHPGSLIHLDIKKLGRFRRPGHRVTGNRREDSPGAGWEYAHVAIDDCSRLGFSELHPDETSASAWRALLSAVRFYRAFGIAIQRLLTDNGACYRSRRFALVCRRLGIRHIRTRPYTPRTNGKAERFIQTALREWAYAYRYHTSEQRARQLPHWLHRYNWHRPHGSLGNKPPISRLALGEDNLMRLHS